ncbi:MAG: sensor histidine kinase [Candidatus Pristimantibacillus sp.]
MRLFLRDQSALIMMYVIQLIVTALIYLLDGYRHYAIIFYASLLSTSLLAVYLVYRYLSNRSFYNRLAQPLTTMESFSSHSQQTPLAEALQQLLGSQFRLYQSELLHYKHKNGDHIQFINQWVHQMKTPISVIHLLIQDEDDKRYSAIGDELDRLRKGLETVLYTARLDSFEHDFYVETLNLEQIIRAVTSSQKRLFIRSGIFPQIEIDNEIQIASDDKWLSFVLTQLITNAIRYTPEGSDRKVHFRGYRIDDEQAVLEVKDEGVGIPKSDLPKVFDAYFTGENGRQYQESTGMGLFLVKQICRKLGHQVEVESEVGKGTIVRIRFMSREARNLTTV